MNAPEGRNLIVDTSAAMAIILGEPGEENLEIHLEAAAVKLMSVVTRVEFGMVLESRLGSVGRDIVDRFLLDTAIQMVPVDQELAAGAMRAWRRYGKGRHPAALNFGDCFTYALAEQTGHPILCTGADFAATDLPVVRP